jgi:hypothetical protein
MQVALRHPSTRKLRFVPTGWSWSIFMGAAFFGLPLFFRGLALWGTAMLVLWFAQLAVSVTVTQGDTLERVLNLAVLGASVYLGFRGNALSVRHFLACGYELVDWENAPARVSDEHRTV